MATGDITFFEEALDFAFFSGFGASDDIKVALLDNTTTPTASFATPALSDFTQVGTSGTYTAGGTSIGGWNALSTESGGTLTFDSSTNPTWAAHASNDQDCYWALIYNDTSADKGIAFVDLGGPVNMQAGSLTITWNASGIFTIS